MRLTRIIQFTSALICVLVAGAAEITDYVEREDIWLGSAGAVVAYEPSDDVLAHRNGEITWLVEAQDLVKEGQIIAQIDAQQHQIALKELELQKASLNAEIRELQWQAGEALVAQRKSLRDLRATRAKLALTPEEETLVGVDILQRVAEEKAELTEQIQRAEEKLKYLEQGEELERSIIKLRLDLEKKEKALIELSETLELVSSSDGTIRNLSQGRIRQGDVVAEIVQAGYFIATVEVSDPAITLVPPEQLTVRLEIEFGRQLSGVFDHVEETVDTLSSVKKLVFKLSDDGEAPSDEKVREGTTRGVMTRIFRKLDKPAYIVPKTEFLFNSPDEILREGWSGFVRRTFPGYKAVMIGSKSIAVRKIAS